VGIVIGTAFGSVTNSLVKDIIMPPIGLVLGRIDFANLYVSLNGQAYASLAEAQAAGAPTLNIGLFITTLLNFIIVAFAMFMIVRAANRMRQPKLPDNAPTTKECSFCYSTVPIKATRCPACTSELAAGATSK
jgi:large conductance mechanosensitive channel